MGCRVPRFGTNIWRDGLTMSTDESKNGSPQTPQEEVLDRIAENFPTWQFPRMVGVDHLNKMLGASRSRTNDSHKLQMAALAEVTGRTITPEGAEDDVSDFSVAGDTTNYISQQSKGLADKVLPLALAAAIGAGCFYYLNKPEESDKVPTIPSKPDTNWQLDVVVTDKP